MKQRTTQKRGRKPLRDEIGRYSRKEVSWLRFILAMAAFLAGCWIAGQVVGYIHYEKLPRPHYYITPVDNVKRDMRVFDPDLEAMILSKHDELWFEGNWISTEKYKIEIVRRAEAKTEPKAPVTVEEKIKAKFGDKAKIAIAVGLCESNLREKAIGDRNLNPSSYGIFQIRAFIGRPSVEDLLTVDKNIEFAYKLSKGGTSWRHWSCFTNGRYLKHL